MIIDLTANYFIIFRERDKPIIDENRTYLMSLLNDNYDFIIIIPYIAPPLYSVSYDGEISICVFNKSIFKVNSFSSFSIQNHIYNLTYNYFRATTNNHFKIVQLGKNVHQNLDKIDLYSSKIIIPHKGNISLLNRCIYFLQTKALETTPIDIIFDSFGYKKFHLEFKSSENIRVYKNSPLDVGPYLGRHHSILQSEQEYIFFQDSDDISTSDRFEHQLNYLLINNLDMVGSHELRIDQFSKTIKIIRFPIDVSAALDKQASHPLFHPTSLVKRSKYLESLGFSLNRKFGSDTQFLLRAHFYMKIGNIDEFYYVRFKRQNSLTTNSKTNLKSDIRLELDKKWKADFEEIKRSDKALQKSSLAFEDYLGDYKLIRINYR